MKVTNLKRKLRKARIIKELKHNALTLMLASIIFASVLGTGIIISDFIGIDVYEEKNNELTNFTQIYNSSMSSGGAHNSIQNSVNISISELENDRTTQAPIEPEYVDPYENLSTEYNLDKHGYVIATKLNVRQKPTTDSPIIKHVFWYQEVMYTESEFEGWYAIKTSDGYGYVSSRYISTEVPDEGKYFEVSGDNYKRKSYMDYRHITSRSSRQWKLQHNYAYTGEYGIRMVNDRYCIALGQYYTNVSGTYVDVYLANGEVLKCILSDSKQWIHTKGVQGKIGLDGGVVEFVVDKPCLAKDVRSMGSISYANRSIFMSEVIGIRVYDKNILD